MQLGIDIGATKTLVAFFEESKITPFKTVQFPTEPQKGSVSFFERLILALGEYKDKITIWGVSTAGAVDEEGTVLWSPNLGWKNFPLKDQLSKFLGPNGIVENDCNVAAYAEFLVRNGVKNLVYVTLSSGIGSGIVVDGKIYRGSHYGAGEIGHTTLEEDGPECSCGRRGCLQAIASGKGLQSQVRTLLNQDLPAEEILSLAQRELEPYHTLVLHAARVLGRFLTNIVDLLDLDRLVLGGGLTKNKFYTDLVIRFISENYYKLPGKKVSVELSVVEPNPQVVGAVLLARKLYG
ncbi:ROK family protein [Pseudothermotoga sp. U03pept]|uniref:ROK family protein n=1 Tax=Pseudothermotoga sp. U03pept TaxID=3447012 RepID=UPI003F128258